MTFSLLPFTIDPCGAGTHGLAKGPQPRVRSRPYEGSSHAHRGQTPASRQDRGRRPGCGSPHGRHYRRGEGACRLERGAQGGRFPVHQQGVFRQHGGAVHGQDDAHLPLHADQRSRREHPASLLRRDHPGDLRPWPGWPGQGRGARIRDPRGLRRQGQPAGDRQRRPVLTVDITFTLNTAGQYRIHYQVHNDSPNLNTVVNLTNHSYFNLAGESSGTAASQPISINADTYTPTDSTQIPLGTEVPVKGTPFDFTSPRTIASGIDDCTQPNSQPCQQLLIAQGYDHNWVLNGTGPRLDGLSLAATAADPGSGRKLSVWT